MNIENMVCRQRKTKFYNLFYRNCDVYFTPAQNWIGAKPSRNFQIAKPRSLTFMNKQKHEITKCLNSSEKLNN